MKRLLILTANWLITLCCGIVIGDVMGREEQVKVEVIAEKPLTEWEVMQLAIIKTESEFNPGAIGGGDDWGLLQITEIYVKEVNRILGEERYSHDDAFNVEKSFEMFKIMQERYNPEQDIDKAIRSHNPTATNAYWKKVRRNMEAISRYETIRGKIK